LEIAKKARSAGWITARYDWAVATVRASVTRLPAVPAAALEQAGQLLGVIERGFEDLADSAHQ